MEGWSDGGMEKTVNEWMASCLLISKAMVTYLLIKGKVATNLPIHLGEDGHQSIHSCWKGSPPTYPFIWVGVAT